MNAYICVEWRLKSLHKTLPNLYAFMHKTCIEASRTLFGETHETREYSFKLTPNQIGRNLTHNLINLTKTYLIQTNRDLALMKKS